MEVETHSSVDAFFHEIVTDAISEADVSASEETAYYLVGILTDLTRQPISDEPLTVKYALASSNPSTQAKELKEVGDTSLYVTGIFSDSLQKGLVASDFYTTLGESAYAQLAELFVRRSALGGVFEQLADKFDAYVDVLARVRAQLCLETGEIADIYTKWASTRSPTLERQLLKHGVILESNDTE